jgi:hypothetical protein
MQHCWLKHIQCSCCAKAAHTNAFHPQSLVGTGPAAACRPLLLLHADYCCWLLHANNCALQTATAQQAFLGVPTCAHQAGLLHRTHHSCWWHALQVQLFKEYHTAITFRLALGRQGQLHHRAIAGKGADSARRVAGHETLAAIAAWQRLATNMLP